MNPSRSISPFFGFILSVGILSGLIWGIYHFSKKNISGEGFLIQYIGINSLVADGKSPYSDQVTDQIRQNVKYQNSFTGGDSPRYSSPLFSGIIVLPFALIKNIQISHTGWLTAQLIAIFVIVLIAVRITEWRPSWYLFFIFTLITFFSYHVTIPWLDGGLAIWAAFFLALVFLSIHNNWNEIGGIFLALTAIQPQMTILVILFTVIWSASQKRRILITWFFMTLIILSIFGLFLVPDWMMQYLRLLINFPRNFPPGNLAALFSILWPGLGKQLGWLMTIILGLLTLIEAWLALKKGFRHFIWAASLIVVITQWIGIPSIPSNLISLVFPLILVAAMFTDRWPNGGQWVAVLMALLLFVWEWALYYFNIIGSQPGMQLNLLIPLPLVSLIGLYWVKWSAIKPKRFMFEELKIAENK